MSDQPHVLVVDDDAGFRRYASRSLRIAGYRCTTSDGVSDALTCLERDRFDLLVVDLRMDDGSGLDLLRRLPERHRLIPAIVVTAMPDLDSAIEAVRMAVIDYVPKPVDDLPARCAGALERAEARQALQRTAEALAEWNAWIAEASERIGALRRRLLDDAPTPAAPTDSPDPGLALQELSPREYEVVTLLAEGLSNKELAARLDISLHTVKNHVKSIFRKLEVASRLELVSRLQRPQAGAERPSA